MRLLIRPFEELFQKMNGMINMVFLKKNTICICPEEMKVLY